MRKSLVLFAICFYSFVSNAQNVGIGVPNPQNKLHVGGGFRLDTLTGVGGAGLVRHDANGVVYGIKFSGNVSDVLRGDGTFGSGGSGSIGWLLNGNSGTNPATHFLGTTDNQPLLFKVNNIRHGYLGNSIFFGNEAGLLNTALTNIGLGSEALRNNSDGFDNIAIGYRSLYSNIGGSTNTAIGIHTLGKSVYSGYNIAIGNYALKDNIEGNYNVGIGYLSLGANISGTQNTAIGNYTLNNNTTGYSNTAVGYSVLNDNNSYYNSAFGSTALSSNTSGHDNTALGVAALNKNRTASFNTSIGAFSLYQNTGGNQNTATGYKALEQNSVGALNTAVGVGALQGNQGGYINSAFGYLALQNNSALSPVPDGNSAFGAYALANNFSGKYNTAIGTAAGYNLPNNVFNVTCIGSGAGFNTTSSNQVNIGDKSVTWIGGQTGWFTYSSDKRIKNNIKEDVPGLAFITKLKALTYYLDIDIQEEIANGGKKPDSEEFKQAAEKDWEGKYDIEKIRMSGFFAQDVETAASEINYSFNGVYKPKNGGVWGLNYSAFVVPLVKAVQEQQNIIEKQQKQIDDLIKRIEALEKK